MNTRSIEAGTSERKKIVQQPKITSAMTPYQKALIGSTEAGGILQTILRRGLGNADLTVSAGYSLVQLNSVRSDGFVDTPLLEPIDEESLPHATNFRMYFGPLDGRKQDRRPVEFTVVRDGVEVDPSELESMRLDPDYEAYYKLQRPKRGRRFHLVLKSTPLQQAG